MIVAMLVGLTAAVLGQTTGVSHVGALREGLRNPARITVALDGTVYVTDPDQGLIVRFAADGSPLTPSWSVPEGPIAIAVHADGRFFVSLRDTPGVAIYDSILTRIGMLGEGNPQVAFVRPTDIDIATDTGRIYVLDSGGNRVYGFTADGTLIVVLGSHGEHNAQFQYPSALSIDEFNNRMVVADQDNFRLQVFTLSGLFVTRFGHRVKFLVGGGEEGWIVRPLGVEVDAAGRSYVADALMNTVRLFDPDGVELGKLIEPATDPGGLRTASDLALSPDGTRLYVVSTNTSSVEIYSTPVIAGGMGAAIETPSDGEGGFDDTAYDAARRMAIRTRGGKRDSSSLPRGVDDDHTAPGNGIAAPGTGFDGPHMIEATVVCGRCHDVDGQPGGHPGLVEGQVVLCASCHNAGGQAMLMPVHDIDMADPYGTNRAADEMGQSHAWGVPAVNAQADSVGPAVGSPMGDFLDGGLIKCSTCHNQHNSDADAPYLRRHNDSDQMCKECHAARNEGPGERGTHPVGFAYPGGTGEFPPAADLGAVSIKNGSVECMTCHGVHGADSGGANAGRGDGMLLRASNNEVLCRECHTEHTVHTPSGAWQPTCLDCHEPHDPDSENLSLIAASVVNQTLGLPFSVVFTSRSGANSFDDGDPAANDGICQVCHTQTAYHKYDGTGARHNDGAVCTGCHPHDNGFMPVGGSSCIGCHSAPQDNGDGIPLGGRPAVVDADGTGGHHLAGVALTDADCVVCHEMSAHRAGTVRLWQDPTNPVTPMALTGDPAQLVPFCSSCHDAMTHPIVHITGAPWGPVCTECHELHDPANGNLSLVQNLVHNDTLAQDMPVVFTARTGANSFDDGDPAVNDGICQVCHTQTAYHKYDGTGTAHNNGADCVTCHAHDNGFIPLGGTSCIGCHSVPQGVRPKVVNADGTGGHHLAGVALTDADCVVCHEMSAHQAGTVRLWQDPTNPVTPMALTGAPAQLVPFCSSCHDAMTHPIVHTTGAPWEPVCTECHELHDPANGNLSLVQDMVHNDTLAQDMPVVFTARTGANSFDDGDPAANNGICQVCHTQTAYHKYDGTGTAHNNGADCVTCHPHQDGFLPTAGSCQDCHNVPRGARRPVIGEFAWASHHLQAGVLDDADCTVCHDMSQHQQGSVRLNNADDPTNPATVVVLTGNPMTNSTEAAKLDAFCLACHDGDGAGGAAPFTDGTMPPVIDATLWNGTSHRVGNISCMGDGETFGCHSTGHGSAKRKLLAPYDASQPPVAGDPLREEEGMCYSCHDADGPAGTDVEALFALTSHHNVSSTEQALDGSKVECTNCHNPHTASSAAKLVDPDTGAVWGGGSPDFCLACHDGVPPIGVSFPATAAGTGFDKSAFVGTTHAAQLGGNSCRHCHLDHGSAYASLMRAQYVTADYNASSSGDGDYALCWLCHDETSIIADSNAFRSYHNTHVRGQDAPCIICHNVHGGFDAGEPGLIDFGYSTQAGYDIQFIGGRDASTAFSIASGQNTGSCYLSCHGKDHTPKTYSRSPNPVVDCSLCHTP